MKYLIILLSLILHPNLYSQSWPSNSSMWHYEIQSECLEGFAEVVVSDNVIHEGQSCQLLTTTIKSYSTCTSEPIYNEYIYGVEYIYSEGNKVYRWVNNNFEILYDFDLEVGDSYIISSELPCQETLELNVIEVGTEVYNDVSLQYYTVEFETNSGSWIEGKIIEKIGRLNTFMFTQPYCVEDILHINTLRCYSDNEFGYFNNQDNSDCDFILSSNEYESFSSAASIYPTSSYGRYFVTSNVDINSLMFYDLNGKIVLEQNYNSKNISILANSLEAGVYIVKVLLMDGTTITQRVIRE